MVSTVSNMIFQEYILYCVPSFKTERVNGTISIERILSVNIPSEHSHKRKVFNPSLGELTGCVGQVDEFRHICAQFMNKNLSEGASMKQATNESKEIAGHISPAISEFLDELNQEFQSKKDNVENKLKHAEEKNKRERARLSSEKRLNILRELSNTSKIDDYEQFCKELLSSGKFSGAQAQKLSELLENSELRSAYSELVNANNKLITMAEKLENLNLSKHKLNKFLNNTLSLIEQHRLEKERDGLVRNCLLYATKFRNNVNDWAVRNPLYADMAELVMDGIGYTVAIVGTIATASALVASAEISVPMAIGSLALKTTRKLSFKYGEQKLIELSSSYGMTEREAGEFRETTAWIIGKAKNMVNIITLGKTLKNTTKPFEDFCKTTLGANKLWQYRQISNQISKNTTAYIAKQRSQMLKNILTELAK